MLKDKIKKIFKKNKVKGVKLGYAHKHKNEIFCYPSLADCAGSTLTEYFFIGGMRHRKQKKLKKM